MPGIVAHLRSFMVRSGSPGPLNTNRGMDWATSISSLNRLTFLRGSTDRAPALDECPPFVAGLAKARARACPSLPAGLFLPDGVPDLARQRGTCHDGPRMRHYPPGPRDRLCGITFHRPLKTDPLAFATKVAKEYGDFAYVRVGWVNLYFVNCPELIRESLPTKAKSFRKPPRQMRALRKIEGDGLAVSEGEPWARPRPVVQGSFPARHVPHYARV